MLAGYASVASGRSRASRGQRVDPVTSGPKVGVVWLAGFRGPLDGNDRRLPLNFTPVDARRVLWITYGMRIDVAEDRGRGLEFTLGVISGALVAAFIASII